MFGPIFYQVAAFNQLHKVSWITSEPMSTWRVEAYLFVEKCLVQVLDQPDLEEIDLNISECLSYLNYISIIRILCVLAHSVA